MITRTAYTCYKNIKQHKHFYNMIRFLEAYSNLNDLNLKQQEQIEKEERQFHFLCVYCTYYGLIEKRDVFGKDVASVTDLGYQILYCYKYPKLSKLLVNLDWITFIFISLTLISTIICIFK